MSPAQLDEAFGALCEDHYRVCLGLPSPQAHHDADGNVPITERIMMQVWEKSLFKSVNKVWRKVWGALQLLCSCRATTVTGSHGKRSTPEGKGGVRLCQ